MPNFAIVKDILHKKRNKKKNKTRDKKNLLKRNSANKMFN